MPSANVTRVLAEIAALSPDEQAEIRVIITSQHDRNGSSEENIFDGIFVESLDRPDLRPSMQWVEDHSTEFAGQYIALEGDSLIAHSHNAEEVISAVRASSVKVPFFTFIPSADALPFAGF